MKNRVLFLLSVFWLTLTNSYPIWANEPPLRVNLIGTGKQLQFDAPARLADIMQASQGNGLSLSYPIATTLFDESKTAKQQSETLKNAVLNQMMQHNLVSHPLYKFIKQQQFAPRLMSELDLDKVRLDKFNNPLLHGTLSLASPERNQYVFYLGNTNTVHKIKSQQGVSLYQQLDNLEPVIGRVAQSPVIIYPNGQVVLPHDGAWLTTQYYLPPLTMVYLPFERYTESELDQNIVSLLAQLKLTQR